MFRPESVDKDEAVKFANNLHDNKIKNRIHLLHVSMPRLHLQGVTNTKLYKHQHTNLGIAMSSIKYYRL
jgi:hypothetical protein